MTLLPPGLSRHRSLNLAVAATLSLAMAAAMIVSGLLDAFLAKPLPHIVDDRVVLVAENDPAETQNRNRITWDMARELRRRTQSFSSFAIASNAAYTVHGFDNTEVAYVPRVSPALFNLLGVRAQLGSVITPANWETAGQPAFLLSDSLWRRRFAADPDIVGRSVRLDDRNATVVGVLPPGFELNTLGSGQQGWVAMEPDRLGEVPGAFVRHFAFAKLAEGVTPGQADAEVARLGAVIRQEFPTAANRNLETVALPLRDTLLGPFQQQLWILFYLAVLVLVVGCLNCAALLLTQALHRRREFAVRQALGASQLRLIRQFWTENIVVTAAASGGALLIAAWSGPALITLLPAAAGADGFALPSLSGTLIGGATLTALVIALIFAVVPWVIARTLPLESTLRSGGRNAATGLAGKAGPWLVSLQIVAAFVLTAGAFVLVKSGKALEETDYGFPIEELYQFRVSVRGDEFAAMETRTRFFEQVRLEIAALPGVGSVSSAFLSYPVPSATASAFVQRQDSVPLAESTKQATVDAVSNAFFTTHDLSAIQGRLFNSSDRPDTRPVAIITAGLAERYWPGESPLGQEVRLQRTGGQTWREIVGVIPDRLSSGHRPQVIDGIILPLSQFTPSGTSVFVRHGGNPPPLETLKRVIWDINPNASIFFESAVADYYANSAWQQRFSMTLLVAFAALAISLCAAGLFAVLSFSVASRDRELGIRCALGATTLDLRREVLAGAGRIVAAGLVGGALVSFFALRGLEGLIYNIPTVSSTGLLTVGGFMAAICLVASWWPARNAGKTDPIVALRQD